MMNKFSNLIWQYNQYRELTELFSKEINTYPKLHNGLTPDHIKKTSSFKITMNMYETCRKETMKIVRELNKNYKKEFRKYNEDIRNIRIKEFKNND